MNDPIYLQAIRLNIYADDGDDYFGVVFTIATRFFVVMWRHANINLNGTTKKALRSRFKPIFIIF